MTTRAWQQQYDQQGDGRRGAGACDMYGPGPQPHQRDQGADPRGAHGDNEGPVAPSIAPREVAAESPAPTSAEAAGLAAFGQQASAGSQEVQLPVRQAICLYPSNVQRYRLK